MFRSAVAFAVLAALLLVGPARAAQPRQTWLVLSDLHFDPFAQPHLVDRLAATPPERWREVFASGEAVGPPGPGSDTNFALLESSLEGARSAAPDPRVVIVAGDFLAHDFRAKFDKTAKTHDDAAYRVFVDKTIAFLAWEIQTAFPRARMLPVVGNNDGYCGDYESTPRDAFLAHMAAAWAASVAGTGGQNFIAQFSTGGYYTEPLPDGGARAIVLNDVFWARQYSNACGNAHDDPGGDEVTWLQATERAIPKGTPVWIIAHLPPGIDAYSSERAGSVPSIVPFLADRFNASFVSALDDGTTVVAIAGHTHENSFRVIGPDPSTPLVPMLVVPSISPVFGNAPAFTVLTVDGDTARVDDSQLFALAKVKGDWVWRREYDFDSIYGRGPIDALHLWNAQRLIFNDERVRRRFEEFYQPGEGAPTVTETNWRAYWCANVALTTTQYAACAMPVINHDLPPQPSAPPPPTPTPTPSPTP